MTEGGKKDDNGKPRFDLIPSEPLLGVMACFAIGGEKYGDKNYTNGIKYSRYYNATYRHLIAWWGGEECDPEDGIHHLDHVATNAMLLRDLMRTCPNHDDRPHNQKPLEERLQERGLLGEDSVPCESVQRG